MIEDRNLQPGQVFEATYKGTRTVAEYHEGGFYLRDGRGPFRTPSAAGKEVTGRSCNGWAFWKPVAEAAELEPEPPEPKAKAARAPRARYAGYRPIKRMDNDGRYFCDGCMRAVHLDAAGACPEGHTAENILEQLGALGQDAEGDGEEAVA